MIVLGVDPSVRACGIAAVDRSARKVLGLWTARSDTTKTDLERYRWIHRHLFAVVHKHRPVAFAVEEQHWAQVGGYERGEFNGDNSKASIVVGVALSAAFSLGLPVFFVNTKRARVNFLGKGRGNATKKEVKAAVERMIGADAGDFSTDAADAVATAFGPSLVELAAAR